MDLWVNMVNLSVIYQLNHSLNNGMKLIRYLLLYIGMTEIWYWFIPFLRWVVLGKSFTHVVLSFFTIKLLLDIKSKSKTKSVSFQLVSMLYLEYLLFALNFFVWVFHYIGYWIAYTEITNEIRRSAFVWSIMNSVIQLSLFKVYIITVYVSGSAPNARKKSHQIHDNGRIEEEV